MKLEQVPLPSEFLEVLGVLKELRGKYCPTEDFPLGYNLGFYEFIFFRS